MLALAGDGHSATSIARLTGIPRATVRDWIAGRVPRVASRAGCTGCGGPGTEGSELDSASYAYLLALYLGDGCLSAHPRGVFKLRIVLDAKYPGIIEECAEAMESVHPGARVRRISRVYNDVEIYAYAKHWPCLFPQHGKGKKHERPIVLADWQTAHTEVAPDRLLRGLIHSDGCRFTNTGTGWTYPRYSFSNRSDDIRAIFMAACELIGVGYTQAPYTVYVSRKRDVDRLAAFIGPKA